MKNLIIGLAVLGLTNLAFSQGSNVDTPKYDLEKFNPIMVNATYLDEVYDQSMADHVRSLEYKVAGPGSQSFKKLDKKVNKPYEILFKSNKGSIHATYDKSGQIIATLERFEDVKLPDAVRNAVFKNHSKWILFKTDYFVSYELGKKVMKEYKVQIRNGKSKKTFRLNSDGNKI